ncbi:hypothetical protein AWENTII_006054 [Aspergillus wentii]
MFSCDICFGDANGKNYGNEEDAEIHWTSTIRALYPTSTGYRVTGVGLYHYGQDNHDYVLKLPADEQGRFLTLKIRNYDYYKKDTFLFHDACWTILKTYFYNVPIPWNRLVYALRLTSSRMVHQLRDLSYDGDRDSPNEPMSVNDVTSAKATIPAPTRRVLTRRRTKGCIPDDEIFMALPLEVRQEIAEYLPMRDFYNLRLASRTMGDLFFDRRFWASKFVLGGDRDFISCLKETTRQLKVKTHWQRLYIRSTSSNLSPSLYRRKTIWQRCCWLRDISLITAPSGHDSYHKDLVEADWDWKEVQAQLRCSDDLPLPQYPNYVQVRCNQGIRIPLSPGTIAVSVIKEMQITYITGLQFKTDKRVISLGHLVPGGVTANRYHHFQGFEVALGERGIHALKVINHGDTASLWIGETLEACITHRLIMQQRVDVLKACFDEYKMVKLAVGSKPLRVAKKQPPPSWMDYMMKNALWYPKIASGKLCFNEDSFSGGDILVPGYRPIVWTLFGDEDGSRLSSLTQMMIMVYRERFWKLVFFYGSEVSFTRGIDLGRLPDVPRNNGPVIRFPIDGPGGERIDSVQVVIRNKSSRISSRYFRSGTPLYYKFSTNRGRHIWTRRDEELLELPKGTSLHTLHIMPGTIPIGFYAVKVRIYF